MYKDSQKQFQKGSSEVGLVFLKKIIKKKIKCDVGTRSIHGTKWKHPKIDLNMCRNSANSNGIFLTNCVIWGKTASVLVLICN